MITAFVIAVVLATIVLWINPRDSRLRWFSIGIFAASACIAIYCLDHWYPQMPDIWVNILTFLTDGAFAISLGMFGAAYSDLFPKRQRTRLLLAGLLLLAIVWLLTPLTPTRMINYDGYNEVPMVLFVCVCLTLGIVSLIVAYRRESHLYKRIERLLTNLLALPLLSGVMISYVVYVFGIDLFQYNYILAIVILILFLTIGVKKGILGVKIKIAMMKADASQDALKGGAGFINHTIKNEVGKIDILLHQLKQTFEANPPHSGPAAAEITEMVTLASGSVLHIQTMMRKVNEKIKTIEVKLEKSNIAPIVEHCLIQLEKVSGQDVSVIRELQAVPDVYMDPVHIREVVMNVLGNAVESMDRRGVLTVALSETSKTVVLQIRDSGKGIEAAALPSIFEPFFSTKNGSDHFGLGLYYCQNVMMKHGGAIDVDSSPGLGSCFYIRLKK
ncbi:sensor histidine kinase [Paenibacillus contaminans]|uniref:histidine kinase n=1 Tax=Paenibacillus contaminans TaxID=450362 RepID=A0A329M601_9BACL|nr:HAMP domain-containing sensor histidine kinase [Paenibacillus contaminans]RAV15579.1 hypothetical protein DQG23_29825 [Paenibacillus contaminans]